MGIRGNLRALALLLLLTASAEARRRPWIFAEDTTVVPDGDVELESWIGFIDRVKSRSDEVRNFSIRLPITLSRP